ncbi:MAG: T9SS type A sorting domain-containing protein [Paludibacteraceae bacterium]|nr:T9SS type A sorting domain-containing protein [Paludibacteraceae bacterium]
MRKTLIGVFSLLSCYFANADTILSVEYNDGNNSKEQMEKLSKIAFDKSGNMTFVYNNGDTKDFGILSNTQKIIFSEGVLANVDDRSSASSIHVFPNPTEESIKVVGLADGESVKIYNLVGTLVLVSQSSEINVSHLADGQYLVVVGNSIIKLIKR